MRYLAASLALLVVLATGLPASTPAAAQPFPGRGIQGGGIVPFAVVLNNIRRSFPGQLSDVQQEGPFYRVKWLTPDGRVLFIDADARSGQILGVSGGGPAPGQAPFMRQNRDRNVDVMRRPDVGPPDGDAFERPAPRQQPLPRGRGRGGRFGPGEED